MSIFSSLGYNPKYADITAVTTSADVVAAVTGKQILVISYVLTMDSAGEYQWLSNATPLTGLMEVAADTPCGLSSAMGVMVTATGEALKLAATQAANGHITYVEVEP